MTNSLDLALRRDGSSTTLVTDDESTSERIIAETEENNHFEWTSQRRLLICVLDHVNKYDTNLNLRSHNRVIVNNTNGRINYLRSKIESSPELYRINDSTKASFNRDRILNLQALFSGKLNSRPSGDIAKYEALKIAITDTCWEQMRGALEAAESIPQIGKTWLAPVLVLLSKFPYYQTSRLKITDAHSNAIKWPVKDEASITKQISPLRRNLLNDSIIPENKKCDCFFSVINQMDFYDGPLFDGIDLFCKKITDEIFLDDDKWNLHIENFLLVSDQTLSSPGTGLSLF